MIVEADRLERDSCSQKPSFTYLTLKKDNPLEFLLVLLQQSTAHCVRVIFNIIRNNAPITIVRQARRLRWQRPCDRDLVEYFAV